MKKSVRYLSLVFLLFVGSCKHQEYIHCFEDQVLGPRFVTCEGLVLGKTSLIIHLDDQKLSGHFYSSYKVDSRDRENKTFVSKFMSYPVAELFVLTKAKKKNRLILTVEHPKVKDLKFNSEIEILRKEFKENTVELEFDLDKTLKVIPNLSRRMNVDGLVFYRTQEFAKENLDESMHRLLDNYLWSIYIKAEDAESPEKFNVFK